MDHRAPFGAASGGPRPPQRAVSGGLYGSSQLPKRPTLPSRLSNFSSVSQPAHVVDLTVDGVKRETSNAEAFLGNKEVVGSPDVIKIEDEDGEPQAKRSKTSGGDFQPIWEERDGYEDNTKEVVSGSPLPSLPRTKPSLKRIAPRRHRFGIEPAARKAHGLEPPAVAIRAPLPAKKVLDFAPWTSNDNLLDKDKLPENILNENVIKAGYFDKPQGPNHNESNGARASIWPNLSQKNHHGLAMLGYLFTAVMEKRQAIGKCTAPSTFKPPPRVTVTDTKREAWLRDLANPDIPLRKQSRTIPHGIRGKLLMEQCLSKDIPLQRAVWLAKCVGANELRAFRRKGVSGSSATNGEVKWVREWTVSVEQFLDGIVATCGQEEWQKNINYGMKLATAFYAEKLLDMDHYLNWIVTSLAEASLERLPVWIVMAQVYWKGITSYGRRGRRLAKSVLEHLHRITELGAEANAPLKLKLQKLIAILSVTNRGCLIIPRVWEEYKYLLAPKLNQNGSENTAANNIMKRNDRLTAPLYRTAANTRSPVLALYSMLDSISIEFDPEDLVEKCVGLVPDMAAVVPALLEWASTPYRTGMARVYIASSMIARLNVSGFDADAVVLQYLRDTKELCSANIENVHRVIIDLVRLGQFSVGRYLQWVITSGVLSASGSATYATGLVAALPTDGLPLHVQNTRNTLMRRLGFVTDESPLSDEILARINNGTSSQTENSCEVQLPGALTLSAQFSIVQRISASLAVTAKGYGTSTQAFGVARKVIECVKDLPSLAALISTAATTSNSALFATVCDTVNIHAESFAAIGQFRSLVEELTEHYLALRSLQSPDRTLILALSTLLQRIPQKSSFVKLLGDDLAICEQQISLAVCSPASDSLTGMHAASLDSDDDIDAVFASGNTMDDQLMQRVFVRIMQRAAKSSPRGPEHHSRVSDWLNQLRSIDGSGLFERLVHNYIRSVARGASDEDVSANAIPSLVSSGCASLSTVAEHVKDVKVPTIAAELLGMFISPDTTAYGLHEYDAYRYHLQQSRCRAESADSLITLIRTACDSPEFAAEDPDLIQFLIQSVSTRPGSVRRIFEDGQHSDTLHTNAGRLLSTLLQHERTPSTKVAQFDVQSLLAMANAFSVGCCLGAMEFLKTIGRWTSEDENVLQDAILKSFTSESVIWPQLLGFAGEGTTQAIHEWAQNQLLCMATTDSSSGSEILRAQLERYLELLAVTSKAANKSDNTTMAVTTIIDHLKDADRQLSEITIGGQGKDGMAKLRNRFHIVLHLAVMHIHDVPHETEVSRTARSNLLATLCSLLVNPKLQTHQDLVGFLFDLSSTLSDSLSEKPPESSLKLPGINKLPSDARLTFILGSNANGVDTWLALASQVHPPGSQQQRVLGKQPSQSLQVGGGRPSISPLAPPGQTHQRWPSHSSHPSLLRQDSRLQAEAKMTPYSLRRWEIMPDPTPVMGENDTSLSLGLFAARKV